MASVSLLYMYISSELYLITVTPYVHVLFIVRYCGVNEYVTMNGTDCRLCPKFTWPDDSTALSCVPIIPRYMHTSDNMALSLEVINGKIETRAMLVLGLVNQILGIVLNRLNQLAYINTII